MNYLFIIIGYVLVICANVNLYRDYDYDLDNNFKKWMRNVTRKNIITKILFLIIIPVWFLKESTVMILVCLYVSACICSLGAIYWVPVGISKLYNILKHD